MGPLNERLCLSIPLNSFALIPEQVERKKRERERGSQESFNVKEDERETAEEKGNKI